MNRLLDILSVFIWGAAGLVIGFSGGTLFGPRVLGNGEGFQDIGTMFNGAILGAGCGILMGIAVWLSQPRPIRRRLLSFVVLAAVGQALLTWMIVRTFDAI